MSHPASAFIPLFPKEEIPFILEAVLRCGRRLKKKEEREREDHLTDRLRDLLDHDRELARRPTELSREVSIYDRQEQKQKPLGRADIVFSFSTGIQKPWPYFTIESKRLHVSYLSGLRPLVDEYVTGKQGMRCFIEGRYARGLTEAAMLAYVFDARVDEARKSVSNLISKNRLDLKAMHADGMQPSQLLIDEVHETHHDLQDRTFVIFHIFLAV